MSLKRIIILTLLCGVQKIESICIGGGACVLVPPLTQAECVATTAIMSHTAPVRCTWQVAPVHVAAGQTVPLGPPPTHWVSVPHDKSYHDHLADYLRVYFASILHDTWYRQNVMTWNRNLFDFYNQKTDAATVEIGVKNLQYLHSEFLKRFRKVQTDKPAWIGDCDDVEPPEIIPEETQAVRNKKKFQWYCDHCPKFLQAYSIVRDLASKLKRLRKKLTDLKNKASANIEYSNYYENDRLEQSIQRSSQIAVSEFAMSERILFYIKMLFIALFVLLVIGLLLMGCCFMLICWCFMKKYFGKNGMNIINNDIEQESI